MNDRDKIVAATLLFVVMFLFSAIICKFILEAFFPGTASDYPFMLYAVEGFVGVAVAAASVRHFFYDSTRF